MRHCQELTLRDALTDPLIRTVMAADRVDPHELDAMLGDIVAALHQRARHQSDTHHAWGTQRNAPQGV